MYKVLEEKTDTDEIFFFILKKIHLRHVPFKNMVQMANFMAFGKLEQIEN